MGGPDGHMRVYGMWALQLKGEYFSFSPARRSVLARGCGLVECAAKRERRSFVFFCAIGDQIAPK